MDGDVEGSNTEHNDMHIDIESDFFLGEELVIHTVWLGD